MMTFGGDYSYNLFMVEGAEKGKGLDLGLFSLSEILSTLHSGVRREGEREQMPTSSWPTAGLEGPVNAASGVSLGHPEEGSF